MLGALVGAFLEETNIWIGGLSKADDHPNVAVHHPTH